MKLLSLVCLAAFCSCSVVEPAWEGTKSGVNTVVGTGEDLVSVVWTEGVYGVVTGVESLSTTAWNGSRDLFGTGVGTVENTVYGAYDFVTDPFTGSDE